MVTAAARIVLVALKSVTLSSIRLAMAKAMVAVAVAQALDLEALLGFSARLAPVISAVRCALPVSIPAG